MRRDLLRRPFTAHEGVASSLQGDDVPEKPHRERPRSAFDVTLRDLECSAAMTDALRRHERMRRERACLTSASTVAYVIPSTRPQSAFSSAGTNNSAAVGEQSKVPYDYTTPKDSFLSESPSDQHQKQKALETLEALARDTAQIQVIADTLHVEAEGEVSPSRRSNKGFHAYTTKLMQELVPFPNMRQFVGSVLREAKKAMKQLEDESSLSEIAITQETLSRVVAELNTTKAALQSSQEEASCLKSLTQQLEAANQEYQQNQQHLEAYIGELRCALSVSANKVLKDIAPLAPDNVDVTPYIQAIRRLTAEVEWLRMENLRLSDEGMSHLDAFTEQSKEMASLLDRANDFQQQMGHLKGTLRVMKEYTTNLESRNQQLENAFSTSIERQFGVLHEKFEKTATMLSNDCVLAAALTQCLDAAPAGSLRVNPVPEEVPVTKAKDLPHLITTTCDRIKLRVTPLDEVNRQIREAFTQYRVCCEGKRPFEHPTFTAHLKGYFEKRTHQEKVALEYAYTLDVLSHHYMLRSCDCLIYYLASHGLVAPDALEVLPHLLILLHERLRRCESSTKKYKDRISRREFLSTFTEVFPSTTMEECNALSAASVQAQQEHPSDDVNYETYFGDAPSLVRDAITRIIVTNSGRFFAALARNVCQMLSVAFRATVPESGSANPPRSDVPSACTSTVDEEEKRANMMSVEQFCAALALTDAKRPPEQVAALVSVAFNISCRSSQDIEESKQRLVSAEQGLERLRERCFCVLTSA